MCVCVFIKLHITAQSDPMILNSHVYEGAPTIVSLIFAVVPKIAVSIVILRLSFLSFWSFFPVFWEDFF